MSMKRLLSIGKKRADKVASDDPAAATDTVTDDADVAGDARDSMADRGASGQVRGSTLGGSGAASITNSFDELQPMFTRGNPESASKFTNDLDLNSNPSISNSRSAHFDDAHIDDDIAPSIATRNSDFSQSKRTFSTNQSSYFSRGSSNHGKSKSSSGPSSAYRSFDYGQPLQILEVNEDINDDKQPHEIVADKLHQLHQDVQFVANKFETGTSNLTSAVISIIDLFKEFVSFADAHLASNPSREWDFSSYNNTSLRKIVAIYLDLYDNYLNDDAYIKLRLLLVRNFNEVASRVNNHHNQLCNNSQSMIKPQNFAIGANRGQQLPNEDILTKIIDRIASTSTTPTNDRGDAPAFNVKEQNGSFIAPITRGSSKELNVLCLYFGYPNPNEYHYSLTKNLRQLYDDLHVLVMSNSIELAAASVGVSAMNDINQNLRQPHHHHPSGHPHPPQSSSQKSPTPRFKLPFRNPTEHTHPPMSLSLSIEDSGRTSGTMGGFIYPKIDLKQQPHLSSYANSKFAISCGHVCLDKKDENVEYPYVSSPSAVLINLYKSALKTQYLKFAQGNTTPNLAGTANASEISKLEAKSAYGSALHQLDEIFPLRKIKVVDPKSKQERIEIRNFPKHRFGQIIWGERSLIQAKRSKDGQQLPEKRLSDLAIIKVNKVINCDSNFLGDDVAFNEFDPALMFDNLYVRKVIQLTRRSKHISLENLNEVDSSVSSVSGSDFNGDDSSGIPVFKYGSTTKFTQGNLNGIKLVYWLDGAIHSSEFVVNSIDKNSSFASGGDSGSWILTKLEDVSSVPETKGLGVVGMLHSYDGEFKQFGLFTPMCEILDRLHDVTNIKWGVVGVSEKHDDGSVASVDSESDIDDENSDSGEDSGSESEGSGYVSGSEGLDDAYPPEID